MSNPRENDGRRELACEDALVLVSRELDGELRPLDRERLEAHLAACPACARERSALSRVDGLLHDAFPADAFGPAFARDVVRAVEVRRASAAPARVAAPRGALLSFRAAGFVAASAAAVLFFAVAIGSLGGSGTVEPGRAAAPVVVARAFGPGLRAASGEASATRASRPLAPGDLIRPDEPVINAGGAGTIFLGDPARVAAFDPLKGDDRLTRIDLRPDTALSFHVERDGGVTVTFGANGGVAYFEVAKQEHPFRVATPSLAATVLGTKFLVEASNESSLVSVVEGRVRVTTTTAHVVLSPRQEAFVATSRAVLLARPSEARKLLAWNPRVLAALGPMTTGTTGAAPGPAASPSPLEPRPTPKPPIDPNLDTPVK